MLWVSEGNGPPEPQERNTMNTLTAAYTTFPNNTTDIRITDDEGNTVYTITLCEGHAFVGMAGVRSRALLDAANLGEVARWEGGAWVLAFPTRTLPLPGGVLARLRKAFGLAA